ncbi:hypothetical protein [Clostridium akagii]|uniref:hypothetical protein n=1 Tax=Clostridium akagii TaxID=91623 RepID=UPI00047A699D
MNQTLITSIIIPILVAVIGTILEIARRQLKSFIDSNRQLIEKQKQALIQSMGIERYNADVAIVKRAVQTVEQLGKEFNWEGTVKHSKVLEMIEGKTGLTDTEIYNIIKAVVLQVNQFKKVVK